MSHILYNSECSSFPYCFTSLTHTPCMSQVTPLYCPNTVSQVQYKTGPTPVSCLCLILCSTYLYLVLHCRSPTSDVCHCMCTTEVGITILFPHDISVYWLYYLAICVHIGKQSRCLSLYVHDWAICVHIDLIGYEPCTLIAWNQRLTYISIFSLHRTHVHCHSHHHWYPPW